METEPALHGGRICFIDVETTGLAFEDPRTKLLEVGIAITDLDLRVIARELVLIRYGFEELFGAARWDRGAAVMHIKQKGGSGLADDCVFGDQALPLAEAEARLCRFVYRHTKMMAHGMGVVPGQGSNNPLAPLWGGCSTLLDRMMLRTHMPQLYGTIHYRTLDATGLRLALNLWLGLKTNKSRELHRGLEDAEDAAKLANVYRRILLRCVNKKDVENAIEAVVASKAVSKL
jgi:oligoribonuclease (3'-5' exoribonuclease)